MTEALDQNMSNLLFVLTAAMILKGEYDRSVVHILFTEFGNAFDDVFEKNWVRCSVTMLDDRSIAVIMNVQLHASYPIFKILEVAFHFRCACELVS